MNRPDLIATFTKIELWRQTQFKRIVYLDADILALRAPDELFTLPLSRPGTQMKQRIAAAPDAGWPDCFNSGVMALTPDLDDYRALRDLAIHGVSFDGADQGLLNMYFGADAWRRLPFGYNCTVVGGSSGFGSSGSSWSAGNQYQYLPAFRHFERSVCLVHFVGYSKPWSGPGLQGEGGNGLVDQWWDVYRRYSLPEPLPGPFAGVPMPEDVGPLDSKSYGYISTVQPPQQQQQLQPQPQQQQQRQETQVEPPWDAPKEPPPQNTKPEGIALQQQTYHMSTDTRLYQPGPSPRQPEPPQTPETPEPRKLPQIFPWESRAPKPTRVFADDASEWQLIDNVTLDTKAGENRSLDVPRAFAPIESGTREPVRPNATNTDDHNRQRDEWVATTAGAFLDILKTAYLYGVYAGV